MPSKSKLWRIFAISFSTISFGLAPALADDCGFFDCRTGLLVQQGYPAVLARYCDGYGGGQWPYSSCSAGGTDYIARPLIPIEAPAPVVVKYRGDADHVTGQHLAKSKPPRLLPSTKSAKQRHDNTSASAASQELHL